MPTPERFVAINGVLTDQLSVYDRGIQYGDGFFTTAVLADGILLNWTAHWQRIERSCQRLQLPLLDEAGILRAIAQLAQQTHCATVTHTVKIIITRGMGGRGYAMPEPTMPTVIVDLSVSPVSWQRNAVGVLSATQTMIDCFYSCQSLAAIQPQLAGLKHLNRLDNVMARSEVEKAALVEGAMLNVDKELIGGTQSNLFVLEGNTLITPKLDRSGVEGTSRALLLQKVEELNWQVEEKTLSLQSLDSANAIFFTNAVRGVMPVQRFAANVLSNELLAPLITQWGVWQEQAGLSVNMLKQSES